MPHDDSLLYLFAEITPKPEHLEDSRAAIEGITPQTLNEVGCHVFALLEGREDDARLFLFEIWKDSQALADHHEKPYTIAVFESYQSWLAEPVKITKMKTGSAHTMPQFSIM